MSNRLLKTRSAGLIRDRSAIVIHAVSDERPTVILARFNEIELVSTTGTMFSFPKGAIARIDSQTLRIAVSTAPNGPERAGSANKGVIGWNTSIGEYTVNLSVGQFQGLGITEHTPFAYAEKKIFTRENHPTTEENIARLIFFTWNGEDGFHVYKNIFV